MAKTTPKKQSTSKTILSNRKAYHDFLVEETFDCGIVLTGTEIKSIRAGKISINQAFAKIENGEVFLTGMHIQPYDAGTYNNHDPLRKRKLLLRKEEIRKLLGKVKTSGYTLVPLKLYFSRAWVKVVLGLCKGKKNYDKRDAIKARDAKRDMDRAMKKS